LKIFQNIVSRFAGPTACGDLPNSEFGQDFLFSRLPTVGVNPAKLDTSVNKFVF
jgi:hypothetical protein